MTQTNRRVTAAHGEVTKVKAEVPLTHDDYRKTEKEIQKLLDQEGVTRTHLSVSGNYRRDGIVIHMNGSGLRAWTEMFGERTITGLSVEDVVGQFTTKFTQFIEARQVPSKADRMPPKPFATNAPAQATA